MIIVNILASVFPNSLFRIVTPPVIKESFIRNDTIVYTLPYILWHNQPHPRSEEACARHFALAPGNPLYSFLAGMWIITLVKRSQKQQISSNGKASADEKAQHTWRL